MNGVRPVCGQDQTLCMGFGCQCYIPASPGEDPALRTLCCACLAPVCQDQAVHAQSSMQDYGPQGSHRFVGSPGGQMTQCWGLVLVHRLGAECQQTTTDLSDHDVCLRGPQDLCCTCLGSSIEEWRMPRPSIPTLDLWDRIQNPDWVRTFSALMAVGLPCTINYSFYNCPFRMHVWFEEMQWRSYVWN